MPRWDDSYPGPGAEVTRPEGRLHRKSNILFASSGELRPAWGVLLFLVLLVGVRALQFFAFTMRMPPDWITTPGGLLTDESLRVACVLAITELLARIERRRLSFYGLGGRQKLRLCGSGMLWGFVTLSLLIASLKLAGVLVLSRPEMTPAIALGYGMRWLLAFFGVAMFEETAFRGYLQYSLARGVGFWWSAAAWSVLFAASHLSNRGEGWMGILQTGWIALFFCASLWLTGSLWWAIGFHATWDWAESFFYGTADSGLKATGHLWSATPHGNPLLSGGDVGPEGSILSLVVLVVPLTALWLAYGRDQRRG